MSPEINCATLELLGAGRLIKHALKISADSINPPTIMATKNLCAKAHAEGLLVNPWSPDKPKDWENLINNGVDSIITNDPEGLYHFLTSKYSK